ncbi:MAG: SagB/ThcOx family dehydrogenase [Methanotrichaceae archaeon]|nr:SagB/ThcOx family dehydrogenase [Methanotrichaceae archaeon]
MSEDLDRVIAYHHRTKHQPHALARGPGGLDYANQPDPFRSYEGATQIRLKRQGFFPHMQEGAQESAQEGISQPSPLNMESLSQLFFESLAFSGQKSFAGSKWSLRVNPSSGNLHPTEGYLIAGPIPGLQSFAGVYHYAPKSHALELLAKIERESWQSLLLPEGTMLLAFSSIYWRESWKYGERAFRYSMLDVGHALATVAVAAHCLGWQASLEDNPGGEDLARLLGLGEQNRFSQDKSEVEHADVLLALFTDGGMHQLSLDSSHLSQLKLQPLPARANILSAQHVPWAWIDLVSEAAKKPPTQDVYSTPPSSPDRVRAEADFSFTTSTSSSTSSTYRYCQMLRRRRSAQVMDGRSCMPLDSFLAIFRAALPKAATFGFLPWEPCVHPVIFVHRVAELERGLYILLRDAAQIEELRAAMLEEFVWERPSRTPQDLELYLLAQGDGRLAAKEASCRQDIASDGCIAVAMLAQFEEPLQKYGPWFYSRLYWECGMIGQAFYLAAEAEGFSGCGIGCFFDDTVHRMLGLSGWGYQDLYHFTLGKALPDARLIDLPAYD